MKNIMTMFTILTFSFSGMYGCCSSAQDQVLDTRVPRKTKSEQKCLSVSSDILKNSDDTPNGIERLKGQFKPSLKNLELGSPIPAEYNDAFYEYLKDHRLKIIK